MGWYGKSTNLLLAKVILAQLFYRLYMCLTCFSSILIKAAYAKPRGPGVSDKEVQFPKKTQMESINHKSDGTQTGGVEE